MTQWHTELNDGDLTAGAALTVSSPHHVVRVVTGDTLMIEAPDGQRLSALVLDRTGSAISLVLPNGQHKALRLHLDEALHGPRAGSVFSHQVWVSH